MAAEHESMIDLRRLPARGLYSHVQDLSSEEFHALLAACRRAARDRRALQNPTVRDRIASVVWAGHPRSRVLLEELLRRSSPAVLVDVHHKLFCAADFMLAEEPRRTRFDGVVALAARYLQRTKSRARYAAWQAGSFLGTDCPLRLSVPLLCRLVVGADHPAGRLGALHGMAHALARLERGKRSTVSAVRALHRVRRRHHGSEEAREADRILAGWRCLE